MMYKWGSRLWNPVEREGEEQGWQPHATSGPHQQDDHKHLSNGEQNSRNPKKQTPESYWCRTPTSRVTCLHRSCWAPLGRKYGEPRCYWPFGHHIASWDTMRTQTWRTSLWHNTSPYSSPSQLDHGSNTLIRATFETALTSWGSWSTTL